MRREIELQPCWYVVHTHPRQEDRADNNLRAWNIETFAPKLRERRLNQFTGEPVHTVKSLFTSYIFARFELNALYHKVSFTRGIHSLVSFGDMPVPVDEEIINIIRSRMDNEGFVRIGEDLRPGDQVTVKDGPLKGFTGVFERELRESERVMILLDTVNYQARVQLEKAMLMKSAQLNNGF